MPYSKSEWGYRGRKGGSSTSLIHLRQPLSLRPKEADGRTTPGHWEADLILFGNKGQALLTLQARHSRLLLTHPVITKDSHGVADALSQLPATFP